ncbi:V-type ATP synthase subunit I [Enterococcus eurekensis]|uniref:V-type ATP synthase subunit I n=1 Tax=Enterococcus eurekensis TaxID=1159753 RepID=A0ABV9M3S6_9ENTE
MAVSRLTKMTLLAERNQHDAILQSLQSIQNIEIEDIFQSDENEQWLATYFPEIEEIDQATISEYTQWLTQIDQGITFIRNHGSSTKKIKELPRKNYSLQGLEAGFNEEALISLLKQIQRLKQEWQKNEQEEQYWQQVEEWATQWYQFDVAPDYTLDSIAIQLAKVEANAWETVRAYLTNEKDIYFEVNHNSEKEVKFSYAVLKEKTSMVQNALIALGVSFEQLPYEETTTELLVKSKKALRKCVETTKKLTIEIGYLKDQVSILQFNEEIILARLTREQAKEKLVLAKHLVVIRAWVNQDDQKKIVTFLQKQFDNALFFSFEEPTKTQIATNQVPTKMKNNRFVAPFEILTGMYSVPKYEEIDPTPWMAPFYLVFFGMMVADLGYGFLTFLFTTLALKFLVLPKGMKKFVELFQILSISIMVWGGIYGSLFGVEMPFQLLAPTEDFMTIFALSVIFGGIQIYTGLFLAAKENIKKKDYLSAISQGFSWQGILTGIFIAAAGSLVFDSALLTSIGTYLALFCAFLVLLVPMIQSKSKVGGFFSGLYELYGITGYIGDFVSYSRLMALGISGGSIAMAFNMLVGTMPPVARYSIGIVLLIALHSLNIFLSMLGAYVHAARLQYVEFFGKFYEGGGRPFDSFKPTEKYVNIEEKLEENTHD